MSDGDLFRTTGKAAIVIDLVKYGPMIIDIDDPDTLRAVLEVIFRDTDDDFKVSAYRTKTEKRAKKLLEKK